MRSRNTESSFGLVEVVVAISIIGATFGILVSLALTSLTLTQEATRRNQTALLLEEGAEAMRILRAQKTTIDGWDTYFADNNSTLPLGQERCLKFSNGNYTVDLLGTNDTEITNNCLITPDGVDIQEFYRTVKVEQAYRSTITASRGNLVAYAPTDVTPVSNTRLITIRVYRRKKENITQLMSDHVQLYLTDR